MNDILFLSTNDGSFTIKDRELLGERYDVTNVDIDVRDHPKNIITYIREIRKHDLVFGWFACPSVSIGIIIASLVNTPSVLVAGGYDVAREPEIGYGLTLNPKYRWLVQTALRKADTVLAVSSSNKEEVLDIAPDANVETVYVGAIDTDTFKPSGPKDSDLVITVGEVKNSNMDKKGLQLFAQTSAQMDDRDFALIGRKTDEDAVEELKRSGGDNLSLTGYLPFDELVDHYQRASIYVQPSIHESFGVSVAEAMACECVPVVSRNGSLPEVVGDTGVHIDDLSPDGIQEAIVRASKMDGGPARKRVQEKFHVEQRRESLYKHAEGKLK